LIAQRDAQKCRKKRLSLKRFLVKVFFGNYPVDLDITEKPGIAVFSPPSKPACAG
jgi:hypothetical protein